MFLRSEIPLKQQCKAAASMCGGPEHVKLDVSCRDRVAAVSEEERNSGMIAKVELCGGDSDDCSGLLELAANNDLTGFKQAVEGGVKVDEVGSWYGRQNGTSQMVLEQRTPAMIASVYGSLDVLKYILNCYATCGGDINRSCGSDGSTALHCAAAGGSPCAVETVGLLLSFGAELNALDAQGRCPSDVMMVSPKFTHMKVTLERILKGTDSMPVDSVEKVPARISATLGTESNVVDACLPNAEAIFETAVESNGVVIHVSEEMDHIITPLLLPLFLSPDTASSSLLSPSPSSSPKSSNKDATKAFGEGAEKIRDFPIDPSLPDIKNSIYTTDEFRMFLFKVRPCSRAYSHDWTECPFVHPGENARRRDPRRYHYSCVPCPDFRKGACRRGDACEYAHGVFECWLHPAQYRTRLCKDGVNCVRRVCFFAHTTEELRPLYVSTGSAVLSPRATCPLDVSLSPPFGPASPSSVLLMSPFSPANPTQSTLSTPPMSPSSSSKNLLGGTWAQSNVPTLHLPGVGLHTSRLRAALRARELPVEDLNRSSDFDALGDFMSLSSQTLSTQARLNAAVAAASGCGNTSSRFGKYRNLGLTISPTNLEDLFGSEMGSSPSAVQESTFLSQLTAQLQSHKSSKIHCQLQSPVQLQVNSQVFPQVSSQMQFQQGAIDCHMQDHVQLQSSLQSSSLSMGSLSHLSSFDLGIDQQSSTEVSLSPAVAAAARAAFAQPEKRSHSLRDMGAGLGWSDWGSPTGKPEWGVQGDDLCKLRKSTSFGFRRSEEPDLSWVQKLVKDGPIDTDSAVGDCSSEGTNDGHRESVDNSVLIAAWNEQMHLDQIAA